MKKNGPKMRRDGILYRKSRDWWYILWISKIISCNIINLLTFKNTWWEETLWHQYHSVMLLNEAISVPSHWNSNFLTFFPNFSCNIGKCGIFKYEKINFNTCPTHSCKSFHWSVKFIFEHWGWPLLDLTQISYVSDTLVFPYKFKFC